MDLLEEKGIRDHSYAKAQKIGKAITMRFGLKYTSKRGKVIGSGEKSRTILREGRKGNVSKAPAKIKRKHSS